MKKNLHSRFIVFALLIYSIFPPTLKAQSLDSTTISRLYYTAKVWGYLKYFHSEVAKGTINWDSVLIQTIPQVTSSTSDQEFKDALMFMIQKAGPMASSNVPLPTIPDSLKYNLNLSWIDELPLSGEIHDSLSVVRGRFRPQVNFYLGQAFDNGNPTFNNDKQFHDAADAFVPSLELRLLGLFRYWNAINYFYPYKNIIDHNWSSTLLEFIPKFELADTPEAYHRTVFELQVRINDSHAFTYCGTPTDSLFSWYSGNPNIYYFPFWLKFINGQTVVYKTLDTSFVKQGDVILQIDGVDIEVIRHRLRPFVQGSNPIVIERNINYRLCRGKQNTMTNLMVENTGGIRQVDITANLNATNWNAGVFAFGPSYSSMQPLGSTKKVGYVNMGKLQVNEVASMFAFMQSNSNGLIFDLRNYPNGTLWSIIQYLIGQPIHIADFTVPDIRYSGTLYWFSEIIGNYRANPYARDIIILFDEETQSQAEYTVMGFEQHPKSLKIGSQTSGADGNISQVFWPGSVSTWFTGLGVFYPDKKPTQRIGIVPDIEVHPTIEGIREGKDEVLEAAINYWLSTADTTAPQVTVGALASPIVNVVRWGIGADETLGSVSLKVNGSAVNLQQQGEIYFGNYTLTDTINLSVEVSATDANLNQASMTRNYQVATLSKGVTYKSYSIMGKGEGYLLTSQISNVDLPVGWTLLGQPLEVITTGTSENVVLKAGYEAGELDQSKIGVYRYESGNWYYLGGEGKEGRIESNIQKGTVAVLYNPDHKSVPKEFALENNYPNPFNPTTTIRYAVPAGSKVTLKVYNILGQEVRSLVNGFRDVGRYQVMWDGRNNGGNQVSSGVYLYRMEAGKFIQTKKMLFVK